MGRVSDSISFRFDPRLLPTVAVAVAAMETGVARRKIDLDHYRQTLEGEGIKSSMIMRRIFEVARQSNRRIVFAEGEDEGACAWRRRG